MMRDFLSWAPWLLKKFNYNINNIKGMEKIQIHCAQIITVLIFFSVILSHFCLWL